MNNLNRVLISDFFDCSTYERTRTSFRGKLLSFDQKLNTFKFAFKVDDSLMRLELTFKDGKCQVYQSYPDSFSEFVLALNEKETYCLTLQSSYKLFFVTEATLINYDDLQINLKYNLYDKNTNEVISFNEISIIGENDVC